MYRNTFALHLQSWPMILVLHADHSIPTRSTWLGVFFSKLSFKNRHNFQMCADFRMFVSTCNYFMFRSVLNIVKTYLWQSNYTSQILFLWLSRNGLFCGPRLKINFLNFILYHAWNQNFFRMGGGSDRYLSLPGGEEVYFR